MSIFPWAIIGINLVLLVGHFLKEGNAPVDMPYSYIGPDYPETIPIQVHSASMTFQPSFHYRINSTLSILNAQQSFQAASTDDMAAEQSIDEWLSTYTSDISYSGTYFVRLGPTYRTFEVALFHQLHCLSTIHKAFVYPEAPVFGEEHVGHCLNYLRETLLCEADDTLEPGDFKELLNGEEQVFERECRDWGTVFDFAKENLAEFRAFRDPDQLK